MWNLLPFAVVRSAIAILRSGHSISGLWNPTSVHTTAASATPFRSSASGALENSNVTDEKKYAALASDPRPDRCFGSPAETVAGMTTKADKIRALALAGYLRTEIATHLDIRYQHVRQVLERSGIDLGRSRGDFAARKAVVKAVASTAIVAPPYPVERLIEAGFSRLGQWALVSDDAFELDCIVPADPGVYVFVVDGVIRYIGLTQRGLRGRMGHYVRGHSRQRTSARVKGLILAALGAGSRVEILIATPEATEWGGLPVLTAPGLEAGLIRMIQPDWNMQGIRA